MNIGHYEGCGKVNSGLFLRRGRIPRKMNFTDYPHTGVALGAYSTGGASPATLTTAYLYNSTGTVHAIRFLARKDCVLTEFWYCTGTNTGTPTGALIIEVRNSGATNNRPDTLITSENHTPTASSWNQVVFTSPVTMTANTQYYIVVGDPAGNATNYYRVYQTNGGYAANLGGVENRWWGQVTTANGFTTAGGLTAAGTTAILGFSDGSYIGQFNNSGGTPGSNTLKRGIYINELETDIEVTGVGVGSGTSWSGVEIFDASQGPRSTPLYRVECTASNRNQFAVYLPIPFRLRAGKSYRIVLTYSANSSSPGQQNVPLFTGLPQRIINILSMDGGRAIPTIETVAGGWATGSTECQISHFSMIVLGNRIIDPRV